MSKIIRSRGTTKSEEYLAKLADRSFLNLWSYPNVYRDVVVNGKPAGKELCDLLVVCGDNVIIFSDKNIAWPNNKDINIAWQRWYRRAVRDSIYQLSGAERWITKNPDRLFTDSACTQHLPIRIPPANKIKLHLVVVALGAHKACSKFFRGDTGSFMVRPSLTDDSHLDQNAKEFAPFTIGDVKSSGNFIHVMNDVTLDIVMKELDTITDFTDYLEQKANFIRSGHLISATGEEELIAYYLTHTGDGDKHGFPHPKNGVWESNDGLFLGGNSYQKLLKNPRYTEKKKADKVSYLWDRLIEQFTNNMLAGTTIIPDGGPFEIADHEIGVRCMAHEPRFMRRLLAQGISEIVIKSNLNDKNFRSIIPSLEKPGNEIGYAFMTLARPRIKLAGGYEQYRAVRRNILLTYCLGILKRFPQIKMIVGIATEPLSEFKNINGTSEDMVTIDQITEWTADLEDALTEDSKRYDILREDKIKMSYRGMDEYPDKKLKKNLNIFERLGIMNRHQRRASEARARKKGIH